MTASNVLQLQASSASGRVAAKDVCTLKPGAAISFTPGTPRALRITEGQAWVTLDDGPHGASREAAGDVFLQAGQTLWVAAGQHAVVETLGRQRLQYRWTGLAPAPYLPGGAVHWAWPACHRRMEPPAAPDGCW